MGQRVGVPAVVDAAAGANRTVKNRRTKSGPGAQARTKSAPHRSLNWVGPLPVLILAGQTHEVRRAAAAAAWTTSLAAPQ